MSDGFEEINLHQHEFNDRPPSRQKEPSLALGIESEYGDEIGEDDHGNKISSEIILTTGIPVPMNDFSSKYTPSQGRRGKGLWVDPKQRSMFKELNILDERPGTSKVKGNFEGKGNKNEEELKLRNEKQRKIYTTKGGRK